MTNQHKRAITIAFVAAGAIAAGYAAGVLSAPKSGKQTRRSIKTAVNRTEKKLLKAAKSAKRQAVSSVNAVKNDVSAKLSDTKSRAAAKDTARPAPGRRSGKQTASARRAPAK